MKIYKAVYKNRAMDYTTIGYYKTKESASKSLIEHLDNVGLPYEETTTIVFTVHVED